MMERKLSFSKSLKVIEFRSFGKFSELKNFRKLSIQNGAPPECYTEIHLTLPWTHDGTSDRQIIEVIHLNQTTLRSLSAKYYECGLIHLFTILSTSAPNLTHLSINFYGPSTNLKSEVSLEVLPNLTNLCVSFSPFNQQYQSFRGALIKSFTALPNLETLIYNPHGILKYQLWFHDFVIGEMSSLKLCPKLKEFQSSITEFTPLQLMSLLKRKHWIKKLTLHFNPENPHQANLEKAFISKFLLYLSNAKVLEYLELNWQLDHDSDGIFPIENHKFGSSLRSINLCSWNSSLQFLESLKALEELNISFNNAHHSRFIYSIYKENKISKLSIENWNFSHEQLNEFISEFPSLTELRISLNPKPNFILEIESNDLVFYSTLNILELNNWNGQNYDFLLHFINLKTLIIRKLPTMSTSTTTEINFPTEFPNLAHTLIKLALSQFNSSLTFINSFSSLENLWLTFNDFDQGIFTHGKKENFEDFYAIFSNLKNLESIHLYKNLGQDKITNNINILNFLSNVKVDMI